MTTQTVRSHKYSHQIRSVDVFCPDGGARGRIMVSSVHINIDNKCWLWEWQVHYYIFIVQLVINMMLEAIKKPSILVKPFTNIAPPTPPSSSSDRIAITEVAPRWWSVNRGVMKCTHGCTNDVHLRGGDNKDTLLRSFQCNELTGRAPYKFRQKSAGELRACDFLPVHSGMAFPRPPQSAAGLNNAVPISTPILHSNSCLLVFPSPSLSRLRGILQESKRLPCWLRPPAV